MTETFYDLLGVADDANTEEIESAYREAIKQVHPDVSDDVDAGERTKRLNKAKRVLTDEDERARYDRLGHEAYTGDGPRGPSRNSTDSRSTTGSEQKSQSDEAGPESPDSEASGTSGPQWGETSDTGFGGGWRSSSVSGTNRSERDRSSGESTWRGSQQRGRRSGRREKHRAGRRPGEGFDVGRSSDSGTASSDTDSPGADTGAGGVSGNGRNRSPGDGTTRSRGDSTGPAWQSSSVTASGASSDSGTAGSSGGSPSAQRQAAAGATDGPNVDWSWNAWQESGAWAVRQGTDGARRLRPSRLFPKGQSLVILGSIFFLHPFFVASMLYPRFPLPAQLTIAVCTLLTFAYLLSIPKAAIAIYGLWSVLVPLGLLAAPGVSLFSLFGVIGLTATWLPLGLSVLTYSLVRP
ncbi:J domain-containing protein [Halosimplex sp. J119]